MKSEPPFRGKNQVGKVFGRLTVIDLARIERQKKNPKMRFAVWRCVCECGNMVAVLGSNLVSGNTTSCGCLHNEQLAERSTKHGYKRSTKPIHPLYWRWQRMIGRCENPNCKDYKYYGGRGITVCERWHDFPKWLEDMGPSFLPGLTLERSNNNGNYEPENVIWDTWAHQRQTKRKRGTALTIPPRKRKP